MKKTLAMLSLMLLIAVTASALVFYPAGNTYADGSWRRYTVYAEDFVDSPPDAPCRSRVSYGPEWCTTASSCMARAAAPPSVPQCASDHGLEYPIYP